MNPFWASLFQELRGHGRNGTLFIAALQLSRDELDKARSKWVKGTNRKPL